jgi:hypothetical protein
MDKGGERREDEKERSSSIRLNHPSALCVILDLKLIVPKCF